MQNLVTTCSVAPFSTDNRKRFVNVAQGWGGATHVRWSNIMTRLGTTLNFVKFSADPLRRLLQRIDRQREQWRRRPPTEDAQPQAPVTTGQRLLVFTGSWEQIKRLWKNFFSSSLSDLDLVYLIYVKLFKYDQNKIFMVVAALNL